MEKELKKKYLELQVIDQNVKQAQKQIQTLETQIMELSAAEEAIAELKETKKGTEILVPISGGIFARAELKDNDGLLVNVGSDTSVKKTVAETRKIIRDQMGEIESLRNSVVKQAQQLVVRAQKLQMEMQELISKRN